MRIKIVLTILLIIVVASLLVITPSGRNLIGNLDTLPGLSSLVNLGPKEYFQMQLVANKEAFSGKTFEITNSTLQISGLCVGFVYVFGANIEKDGTCTIIAEDAKGKVEYSSIGTMEGSIETRQVSLDNSVVIPSGDKRVRFTVVPSDMYLSNYNSNSVSLPSVVGEIKKFKVDGTDDQVKVLSAEKVEIQNYLGNVRLSFNNLILSGFATKVNWFS